MNRKWNIKYKESLAVTCVSIFIPPGFLTPFTSPHNFKTVCYIVCSIKQWKEIEESGMCTLVSFPVSALPVSLISSLPNPSLPGSVQMLCRKMKKHFSTIIISLYSPHCLSYVSQPAGFRSVTHQIFYV